MPSYNCRKCNGLLDPTEVVRCPGCNEKKPLVCSKCSAPINHHDIHEIEKLRVKKPLLCNACGTDNQVVKCALCNVGLVRSQGETVSKLEGAKVYHKNCLRKRRNELDVATKAAPAVAAFGLVIGLIFLATSANRMLPAGAIIVGFLLYITIKGLITVFEPR